MEFDFIMNKSIARKAVAFLATVLAGLVVLIGAVTTFTYGYEVIGAFIMPSLIGESLSRIVSGILTTLLFDVSYITALFVFIYVAESTMQRAVTLIQLVTCALFSVLASIVSMSLLGNAADVLTADTLHGMQITGMVVLIVAFVLGVVSLIINTLSAPNVQTLIDGATREAERIEFERDMVLQLDNQTFDQARTLIEAEIPRLAQLRAANLLTSYVASIGQMPVSLPNQTLASMPSAQEPATVSTDSILFADDKGEPSEDSPRSPFRLRKDGADATTERTAADNDGEEL